MKFLISFLSLWFFFFEFNSDVWALVWRENLSAKSLQLSKSEKIFAYTLNDREVLFKKGQTKTSLQNIGNIFKNHAQKKKAYYVEQAVGSHLISCFVENLKNLGAITREKVMDLKGKCLFARDRKGNISYQIIEFNGFPDLHKPQSISLNGIPIHLTKKDQYFHLQSKDQKGFSLFALKKKAHNQDFLNSWKSHWQKDGWKPHSHGPHPTNQFSKGKHTLLTNETKNLITVIKK